MPIFIFINDPVLPQVDGVVATERVQLTASTDVWQLK